MTGIRARQQVNCLRPQWNGTEDAGCGKCWYRPHIRLLPIRCDGW